MSTATCTVQGLLPHTAATNSAWNDIELVYHISLQITHLQKPIGSMWMMKPNHDHCLNGFSCSKISMDISGKICVHTLPCLIHRTNTIWPWVCHGTSCSKSNTTTCKWQIMHGTSIGIQRLTMVCTYTCCNLHFARSATEHWLFTVPNQDHILISHEADCSTEVMNCKTNKIVHLLQSSRMFCQKSAYAT